MVSVIIPAFNEQETIAEVVRFSWSEPMVSEVIVVDDKSEDDTVKNAQIAGAKVIISEHRGKGFSMQDGISVATNQLLVFLDADIHPYPEKTISKLLQPLIDNEADFVKGAFARNAGRVTELVAKPLLKIFFPELSAFQQPLSGMIAGKKSFLRKVDYFTDYGVDVGILIDMFLMQARVKEINIGYIENKSKPWQQLGKMSSEVSKAIIQKATLRQKDHVNLNELGLMHVITEELGTSVKDEMQALRKIIVFDMDNTLLQGRFIDTLAEKHLFEEELNRLRLIEKNPAVLTKRIANLIRGLSMGELLQTAASIPIVPDAEEVVNVLRSKGYIIGIISDSYQLVVDYVKSKIGADFAIGNRLEFYEGKATGEIIIPSWFYNNLESKCLHEVCKTNAVMHISKRYNIPLQYCICIGDSENDLCMIQKAGIGVAFCTSKNSLLEQADMIINQPSFRSLLLLEEKKYYKGTVQRFYFQG